MELITNYGLYVPQNVPGKMSGKLTHKIILKKDHTRADGTNALYLQMFQDKKRVRLPLGIAVPERHFDDAKQRVKRHNQFSEEYNLVIGKILSDLNKILVSYTLSNTPILLKNVVSDLTQPTARANYNEFAKVQLAYQRDLKVKDSTYKQQVGILKKIAEFQDPILFSEINEELVARLRRWCLVDKKNKPATVESTMKTFKKYVHLANKNGIRTPLNYEDIKVKRMIGDRTFLTPMELRKVYKYYHSEFIGEVQKNVLQRYLFSCFTGVRISDIEHLSHDNLFGDYLGLTMDKTKNFIRIKLNKVALSLIGEKEFFSGQYTRQHINQELKHIAKSLGITKRLYYHSSRHTFATNFLISGGDVVNLQRLLGHSDIKQTMVYVHIVNDITDKQVDLLDEIIK